MLAPQMAQQPPCNGERAHSNAWVGARGYNQATCRIERSSSGPCLFTPARVALLLDAELQWQSDASRRAGRGPRASNALLGPNSSPTPCNWAEQLLS